MARGPQFGHVYVMQKIRKGSKSFERVNKWTDSSLEGPRCMSDIDYVGIMHNAKT